MSDDELIDNKQTTREKISDNEIRQILEALESEEQEVQEDLQELKSSGKDLLKDW